ncbi:YesL family protein [bacterium]|nr:YesL family protein [bacterium]
MKIFGFLFDTDSKFAKITSKIAMIVIANLLFLIFCIPIVTVGAAYTALYHVMMKSFRNGSDINVISEFWKGFKNNFIQATICWVGYLLFLGIGLLNIFWCSQLGGLFLYLECGIAIMVLLIGALMLFMGPMIAAFENKTKILLGNAVFLVIKKPIISAGFLGVNIIPVLVAVLDKVNQPTYAFCFFFFAFGLNAWIGAWIILKTFIQYLPPVEKEDEGEKEE